VKARKDDDRDVEAATRPAVRFVELKSEKRLDRRTLHRARSRPVGERTALIDQLRGVPLGRGVTVPQGRHKLEPPLAGMTAGDGRPSSVRTPLLIDGMRAEWREPDRRIAALGEGLAAEARSGRAIHPLAAIPGIEVPARSRGWRESASGATPTRAPC
jgi:transposase